MSTEEQENNNPEKEPKKEKVSRQRSIGRILANICLYLFISTIVLLLTLVAGIHTALKYYPEELVGEGLKRTISKSTNNQYNLDYESINVKLISGWSIHDFLSSGSISISNAVYTPDSLFIEENEHVSLNKKKNIVEVRAKTISIQNISLLRALFQEEVYVGNILIDSVTTDLHKYQKGKKKKNVEETPHDKFADVKKFYNKQADKFHRYRIGNIEIKNSSVQYFDHTKKIKQQISLGEISGDINDIYLDNNTLKQELLPLHVGSIEFSTNDLRLELENTPLGLSFGKINFSTLDSSLLIYSTSLYKINHHEKKSSLVNATIPIFYVDGINIKEILSDSILHLKKVEVTQPQSELQFLSNSTKKKNKKTPKLPPFLKEIIIDSLQVLNAETEFETVKTGKRKINDLTINVKDVSISNTTFKNKVPVNFDNFTVKLGYQRWYLPNHQYAKVGGLFYHSKWQKLYIYSPAFRPSIKIPDSTSTTYVDASAKRITLDYIDYQDFLKKPLDSIMSYEHLLVDQPKVDIWFPTHKQEKVKKQKRVKPLYFALNESIISNAKIQLHLPKDHKYQNKIAVEKLNLNLDSLVLPIHNPKEFQLKNALLTVNDIRVPDISGYDILLEKSTFSTTDSTLIFNGINLSNSVNKNQKHVDVDTYVKSISIADIGWRRYLQSDSLFLGKIFVDIPSSEINLPIKEAKKQLDQLSNKEELQKKKPKGLPFKYLEIADFHLRKGPITLYQEGKGLIVRAESTGLDVENLVIEDKKVDWKNITFLMDDIYLPLDKIHHQLIIGNIHFNVEKQKFGINGFTISPTEQKIYRDQHILCGINSLDIYGLDLRMLIDLKQVDADSINVFGARGVISIDQSVAKKKKKKAETTLPLNYIGIGKVNIKVDDLGFLYTDKNSVETYLTFYGGSLIVDELRSKPGVDKEIETIIPKDVFLEFKGLEVENDHSHYKIRSNKVVLDTKGDSLLLVSTGITPVLGNQAVNILDSLVSLNVKNLRVQGAGLKKLIKDKEIDVDSLIAQEIKFVNASKRKKVEKVGTFAEKTFPKEKVEELLKKFNGIHVDYIQIDKSEVVLRNPVKGVKQNNISRLMRRDNSRTPLNEDKVSPKQLDKYSRKINRISGRKRYTEEEKTKMIEDIVNITKGNPIDVYTLTEVVDDSAMLRKHNYSFMTENHENTIRDINVVIKDIAIDEETIKLDTNYIQIASIDVNVGKNVYVLNNNMYALGFDSLNFNSHYSDIYLKNFKLIPQYSKKSFGLANEYQTDRIDLNINDLLLRGFHFKNYFFNDYVHLNGVEIDRLSLSAYRDKTVPVDPQKKNPKMIHTILETMPILMRLDTITITDSHVDYEEYKGSIRSNQEDKEETAKSGQFQLNDFTGQIFNITNDTSKISVDPYTEMYVKGTLMEGGGLLKMYFRIPPLDSLGTYYYEGEVGEMELIKLNPLLERLELVKVKDGHLKRMYFKVLADDSVAMGNMQFRYKNLEVDVLKDKTNRNGQLKRRAFISSVANLLIREENPRFPSMRQGHIYNVRNQKKFIFNYWVKTVLSGVASTLSPLMEPDFKHDKDAKVEIRYIEKNTKRKNRLKGPLKMVH
ncbi:hypothetical protein [Flammeovirga kamogawensis]|uniref:DUF748 domain-containing protein n=1 Tax=Flammeovirga kamogawensis TaxID=373891 RepID=A0ABX8GYB7_9BACT|nr:hypothetical protein [Flammeovirga kamogawensis]MBB6462885.1 hypothetical protein [Flammeovirga kamogawensis]QWG08333.1 hypothetical protein KM029_05200 [Flammeovirga kamogawensis]TRX66630.1 hypothetical protein EO216_00260 [Flammeovirga kamogawensis]